MTTRINNQDTKADNELRKYLSCPSGLRFIVVAGAGSGKTTSLVKALDFVEKEHGYKLRQRGQRVACITYTEVAVGEILSDIGDNSLFHVSTIHSFLWSLVRPFQEDIRKWLKNTIETRIGELEAEHASYAKRRVRPTTVIKTVDEIARCKLAVAGLDSIEQFRYESARDHSRGVLGHSDIVAMVPALVQEHRLLSSIVAGKYPFIVVDESQDTLPVLVNALKTVADRNVEEFCLGFFGDPMQQIYPTGVGTIETDNAWQIVTKEDNFRCPTDVLAVINSIRKEADSVLQVGGRRQRIDGVDVPVKGSANLFIFPADAGRRESESRVRQWLAAHLADPLWSENAADADLRVLVIEHRMAAESLGFADLFDAFDNATRESLRESFRNGTCWVVRPFLDVLLPLSRAVSDGRDYDVIELMRRHSPLLSKDHTKPGYPTPGVLGSLNADATTLTHLLSSASEATVLDVLRFVREHKLISLDERLASRILMASDPIEGATEAESDQPIDAEDDTIDRFLSCKATQLWAYDSYINERSPYSTQHGIKGAEFERVLVVLDDARSRNRQFSYMKLLGLQPPSDADIRNEQEGKDTTIDRTRRLFYVCCSRATKDLAVLLYTDDPTNAASILREEGIFDPDSVYTESEL